VVKIGLKDIYYKVEDKWFRTIDWMNSKGLPSYSLIDPLEKRGIPSLPVYVALLIIVLYFALPMIGIIQPTENGIPDEDVEVSIFAFNENTGESLEDITIEALVDNEIYSQGQTAQDGEIELSLQRGETYKITAKTEQCEETSMLYKVPIEEEPTQQTLSLEDCTYHVEPNATEICFEPDGIGTVSYEKLSGFRGYVEEEDQCEGETCYIELETDYLYRFKTPDYVSESSYTKEDLETTEGTDCVPMEEEDDDGPPENYGDVTIKVMDEMGEPLGGRTVQLVHPESTSYDITDGVTSEQEGSIGKVSFSKPLETEFHVKVLAGDGTGSKLHNETTYVFTQQHQEIEIILERYEDTPIQVTREEDEEPIENVLIRIFEDDEEIYEGETDSEGEADPVPNLREDITYEANIFKENHTSITGEEIQGGESYNLQIQELGEYEIADIRATVRENTEERPAIRGARVDLKTQEEEDPIRETKTTNNLGRVSFGSIPEGDYCLEVNYKAREYPCSDNPVTINPTEESLAKRTILVDPLIRYLELRTTVEGEAEEGVEIEAEDRHGRQYGPTETDTHGLAGFDVPDERTLGITANKEIDGEVYTSWREVKVDDDLTINMDLDRIEREINLNRVTGPEGEYEPGENNLNPNTVYEAEFEIGLEDHGEEEWDEIIATLETDNELNLYPVKEAGDGGWYTGEEPGKEQELNIQGPGYKASDTTAEFTVPFIVHPIAGEEVTVNYQASWEKDDTHIETEEKEFSFNINRGDGSEEGQFYVERCIDHDETDGCETPPGDEKADPKSTATAVYRITNLGDTFTGEMKFESELNNTNIIGEYEGSGEDDEEPLIWINRTTAETEQGKIEIEDYTLEDNILSFNLDEEEALRQNDELTVEVSNEPKYSSSEIIINGTAEDTELGKIRYETSGSIEIQAILDQGKLFSLSTTIDIEILNKEKMAPLTEEQLQKVREESKIEGDLSGCNEIDLSETGRTEITENNLLRVKLDENCHLNPGNIDIKIEGGDIEERTVSSKIGKSMELHSGGSTQITPGNQCSINLIKQGFTSEIEGIGETLKMPNKCSEEEGKSGKIIINYPEEVISEENIETHSLKMNAEEVPQNILEEYIDAEMQDNSIHISTDEEIQPGTINLDLEFTTKAMNNGITEEETRKIGIDVTTPSKELGGNRFTRNLIQSYGTEIGEYSCSERYCSLEQALEYTLVTPDPSVQIKLVDTGHITPSDIQETLQYGPDENLNKTDKFDNIAVTRGTLDNLDEIDFAEYKDQGNKEIIIVSEETENMPGVGENTGTVIKGTKEDLDYYYITFTHHDEKTPFLVESLALWMPYTETGAREEISSTPIYIDETLEDHDTENIEQNIISALEEMWGIDEYLEEYIYSGEDEKEDFEEYEHGIHIGICPEEDQDHENCERISNRTYDKGRSLIFRGHLESKIYIHAPTKETLENLSERFNLAFGNQRSGMALQMLKWDEPSEGALTFAPEELTYYCWSEKSENTTCPGGENTLKQLTSIGEIQIGKDHVEVKQREDLTEVIEDDEIGVDWISASVDNTQDLRHSGQVVWDYWGEDTGAMRLNHYVTYYRNIFGRGLKTEKVRIPSGGIIFQPEGPNILLIPHDQEEDTLLLLEKFKDQLLLQGG